MARREKPPECHWKRAGTGLIPRNEPDHVGIGVTPTKDARLDVFTGGERLAIRARSVAQPAVEASSSKNIAVRAKAENSSGISASGLRWGVIGVGGEKGGTNAGGVRGIGKIETPGVFGRSEKGPGSLGRSDTGPGVRGQSKSDVGVFGSSSTGLGVRGRSESNVGVLGRSVKSIGVQGDAFAALQPRVKGTSVSGAGVLGQSKHFRAVSGESETGTGVDGVSNAGTGVSGISTDGTGVFGETGSIDTAAVVGRNPNGIAVEGIGGFIGVQGTTTTGTGVLGETKSGAGVTGRSGAGVALLADATTGDLIKCVSGLTERFRVANNGNVFVNGKTVHTSDAREKTRVAPLRNVLGKLNRIRGVSFLRRGSPRGPRSIGVLAQDVRAVFPELVSASENKQLGVDYAGLAAVLLEAIKDLTAENTTLGRRLEVLERGRGPRATR